VALAVIGLLSAVVVGMPLGVTSSFAKIGGWAEQLLAPEYVERAAFSGPSRCITGIR